MHHILAPLRKIFVRSVIKSAVEIIFSRRYWSRLYIEDAVDVQRGR
jgi:hypothetical protein